MIADRLFDLLPLMFGVLGGGVVAVQMMTHTRQRLRRSRRQHEGQHNRVTAASRGVRERAATTLALRREEQQMRRELARLNQQIEDGERQAEREKATESQIYVFDERKNMGDQAYVFQISHTDFNSLARNAPDEVVKSWRSGRRYMVWAASEKMAMAKAGMRFNADKGYRVSAPAPFEGDPEAF
ncbi:hypothetical protein CHU95_17900 [Niveispirillum lacus]|uniref:Uncharacterized protein n=1 Tax=Niveispirillum lacus TaxID=1981099 RepID=A0A255YTS9_9PROT|nr:hypothetical protein [Niveispirillum lacus]OYQ32646.1 hypothetical protein CHU95_17900 [Niveispirillum lacus]